jgi:hypothetical protein
MFRRASTPASIRPGRKASVCHCSAAVWRALSDFNILLREIRTALDEKGVVRDLPVRLYKISASVSNGSGTASIVPCTIS